jgi:hypothetical protein
MGVALYSVQGQAAGYGCVKSCRLFFPCKACQEKMKLLIKDVSR